MGPFDPFLLGSDQFQGSDSETPGNTEILCLLRLSIDLKPQRTEPILSGAFFSAVDEIRSHRFETMVETRTLVGI